MNEEKLILVAEDNREVGRLLCVALAQELGVRVVWAADGVEALSRIAQEKPALVVLDIVMPRIDGLRVLRRLKAQPFTRDIPVIAVSASDDARRQALDAGCDEWLAKPFDLSEIVATVAKYLDVSRPKERAA